MNLLHSKSWHWEPKHIARIVIIFCGIVFSVWLLNRLVAFTGDITITVSNVQYLPAGVTYSPSTPVSVDFVGGKHLARPVKEKIEYQVALPRGFDSLEVQAKVVTDENAKVNLGAKVRSGGYVMSTFHAPFIYPKDWNSFQLSDGTLYVKPSNNVNSLEDFWKNVGNFKKIISYGGNFENEIPFSAYGNTLSAKEVSIQGGYRGELNINAFLYENTSHIKFILKSLGIQPGVDTLQVEVYQGKNKIFSHTTKEQLVATTNPLEYQIKLPNLKPGLYNVKFKPNNEDSVISGIQLVATDVLLSERVFMVPSNSPVTFFSTCGPLLVEAVHQQGIQYPPVVNGVSMRFENVKQQTAVGSPRLPLSILIPRGDVGITTTCGLRISQSQPTRDAFSKIVKRVTYHDNLKNSDIKDVDAVYDSALKMNKVSSGKYVISQTYALDKMLSKDNTFFVSLSYPESSETSKHFYVEKITFVAHREPFKFSDILPIIRKIVSN